MILCVLFWSGNFIIGRFFHADIQPLQLAFFRWFGAAIIVLQILIKNFSNIYKTFKEHYIVLNILSILGVTIFNTFLYIGLQDTTATNALIINSSIPVLILVLSFVVLKIPINLKQLIGIHEIGANKTGQFTHLMPLFGAIFIGFGIYLSLFSKKEEKR